MTKRNSAMINAAVFTKDELKQLVTGGAAEFQPIQVNMTVPNADVVYRR